MSSSFSREDESNYNLQVEPKGESYPYQMEQGQLKSETQSRNEKSYAST